jgi:hypothetical protein
MKRIDEKPFCGAGAGDEIVNTTVMPIATEANQRYQGLRVKSKTRHVESVCCSLQDPLLNLATAQAEECNRKSEPL